MDRWSRRWAVGREQQGESEGHPRSRCPRDRTGPQGSAEQLLGDLLRRLHGRDRESTQLGTKPAQPLLAKIDALKNMAAVQAHDRRAARPGHFRARSRRRRQQDLHDPTMVIAHLGAGGLGLPDRDYYLKPEPRFVEARAKYLAHVDKMFELAGAQAGRGQAGGRHRVRVRDSASPRPRSTTWRCAIPKQQDHKTTFAELAEARRRISTGRAYFDAPKLPHGDLNVTQPNSCRSSTSDLHDRRRSPIGRPTCDGSSLNATADTLSEPHRRGELRVLRQVPHRRRPR